MSVPGDRHDDGQDDTAFLGAAHVPRQSGEPEPERAAASPPGGEETRPGRADPTDREPPIALVPTQRIPQPPPIDPAELTGLTGAEDQTATARRVSPLQDEASGIVARYLFPTERYRGEWRRHVIHLVWPAVMTVVATVGLGLLGGFMAAAVPGSASLAVSMSLLLWVGVLLWVAWRVADWHFDRFILTNKRVMKVSGIITRNVAMMPLARVTDMKYQQSPIGRIFNYGTFVLESAGQDQALREVPHLPNPNELYLRVVEEMYEPEAVEARLGKDDEEDDERADA